MRNNSTIIILIKQLFKDAENACTVAPGFYMIKEEIKDLCREAWEKKWELIFLFMDSKKKKGKNYTCHKNKKCLLIVCQKQILFNLLRPKINFPSRNQVEFWALEQLTKLKQQEREVQLQKKLGNHGFH